MNRLIQNLEKFITHNNNYNLKHFIPKFDNELNKFIPKKNYISVVDKNSKDTSAISRGSIIYSTNRYDIIGINLDNKESIDINDKYDHGYIYKIVNGKVKEEIFNKDNNKIDEKILKIGDVSYLKNEYTYKITNLENMTQMIHIYSPAKSHLFNKIV